MLPQSSSGWVPPRGWFYALAGLVIVETTWLAGPLWQQPSPPKTAAIPPVSVRPPAPAVASAPPPVLVSAEPSDEAASLPALDPLSRAQATRHRVRRARRFEDLGASLADNPHDALQLLRELTPADRPAFARGMFDRLARGDRQHAMEAAKLLPDESTKEAALTTLLAAWQGAGAPPSPTRLASYVSRYGLEAGLGMQLLASPSADPDLVAQWARQLTTGEGQAALLGRLAGGLAASDPARASAYAGGLTGNERDAFVENFAGSIPPQQLAEHPQEMLSWSAQVTDEELRSSLRERIFDRWADRDPQAAAQAALALPPGSEHDQALQTVAERMATHNTAAADAFAQSLSGRDHDLVDGAIQQVTPVGIGAALSRDAGGYPVVASVVDNMPAALSGLIHPGDRIVGVTRPDGVLVDAGALDLPQVINLIRGLPASTVQLQVAQPSNAGGFSPPTTITLIRQRITHG